MLHHELAMLRQQAATSGAQLVALLVEFPKPALPALRPLKLSIDTLRTRALAHKPAVLRARAEVAITEAADAIAQREGQVPDLEAGLMAGRTMDLGMPYLGGMVTMNLPFLRPDSHGLQQKETQSRLEAARHQLDQVLLDTKFQVQELWERLKALEAQLDLHEKVLEPQAELGLKSTRASVAVGKADLSILLTREAEADEIVRTGERLLADHAQAIADLEAVLGIALGELEK
jgi:outer membrane protein TolC